MTEGFVQASSALASDAFGMALGPLAGLDVSFAAMMAALVILFAFQVHSATTRARQMRTIKKEMRRLRAANGSMKEALGDTKRKVAEVALAIAKKSDARERKMAGELQILEGLIRDLAANMDAKVESSAQTGITELREEPTGPTEAPTDPAMLEIIRRALEDNRIDLHLQPVVSLPQRKLRFYEALSRLRSEDGTVIMPAQFVRIAAPAGLMSVVDNLLLFRCVQVVRRLTHKRREIGVFCNISGHTLKDAEFFPQFLDFMHHYRDLGGQIIFEFAQDSVLSAGPQEEANLRYLSGLGFRLSMDQVTKLDFDFAASRRLGFQFLKLHANTLLTGMKDARAQVAAEDLKDLLARNGLNLICDCVEDEKTVVQLLECNVDFGQGYLFGAPRALREVAEANDVRAPNPAHTAPLPAGLARRLAG